MNSSNTYCPVFITRLLSIFFNGKTKVELMDFFSHETLVIEVDAKDSELQNFLFKRNCLKYLALVDGPDGNISNIVSETKLPAENVSPYLSSKQISQNNADVLILSHESIAHFWFFDEYKHAQYVLFSPSYSSTTLLGLLGLIKNTLKKRVQVIGATALDHNDRYRPFLVVKILESRRPKARHYISPMVGVNDFFKALKEKQVKYSILRWFEDLPEIAPGEDIDMIVDDDDIETVEIIMKEQPGLIPCDLYSASGLPGTEYKDMAYYSTPLAKQILEGSIQFKNHFLVPNPKDHFLSLAYHALYHKGKNSGIPTSVNRQDSTIEPEHDYESVLTSLAEALGINIQITMEDIDRYLCLQGWRPPLDTLSRLANQNEWIRNQISSINHQVDNNYYGLSVFLIRKKAIGLKLQDTILERLTQEGFYILQSKLLDHPEIEAIKPKIRGGNWGKGPFPVSGGEPEMIVVAFDVLPIPPDTESRTKYPNLDNNRILIKNKIRDSLNNCLDPLEQFNMLHSSDNEQEAWDYIHIISPTEIENIQYKINELRDSFATQQIVVKDLSRYGRRAKVELIEYKGGLAVKKTFRPGCERFFERELHALQAFSDLRSEIPELLEYGSQFIICPYYDDAFNHKNIFDHKSYRSKLLPLEYAKQLMDILLFFYESGYSLIDFSPQNIIIDRKEGLKVIDFEFLYRYTILPESFEGSYELSGFPNEFDEDFPISSTGTALRKTYKSHWQPFIGLKLEELLYDPWWLQYAKRLFYSAFHLPYRSVKDITSRLRAKISLGLKISRGIDHVVQILDGFVTRLIYRA